MSKPKTYWDRWATAHPEKIKLYRSRHAEKEKLQSHQRKSRRACLFPKCNMLLSRYNTEKFCCLHQRILNQNDAAYRGGKYFLDAYTTYKSPSGKQKRAKVKLTRRQLLSLKEKVLLSDLPFDEPK